MNKDRAYEVVVGCKHLPEGACIQCVRDAITGTDIPTHNERDLAAAHAERDDYSKALVAAAELGTELRRERDAARASLAQRDRFIESMTTRAQEVALQKMDVERERDAARASEKAMGERVATVERERDEWKKAATKDLKMLHAARDALQEIKNRIDRRHEDPLFAERITFYVNDALATPPAEAQPQATGTKPACSRCSA